MTFLLPHLQAVLAPHRDCRRWVVAYSGGLDSRVLLELLVQWREETPGSRLPALEAVHVDHQLQADSSRWAAHCRAVCESLGVPLESRRVEVDGGSRRGLEARARAARYRVFEEVIGPDDLLLMAHHRDDQVETVLLRLLRGSGLNGLSAMPGQRALGAGRLLRPLLAVDRRALEDYATERRLEWVEDSSNADRRFDRNYLRHEVTPLLERRWPGYRETLTRLARMAADSADLLRQLAQEDIARTGGADTLPLDALSRLDARRQRNALYHWLLQRGVGAVGADQLEQLMADVVSAAEDAEPEFVLGECEVRRYRGRLYVTAMPSPQDGDWRARWALAAPLILPGAGVLEAAPASGGGGLRCDGEVEVRFRRGGERCRPAGRHHSRSLKKLLQEYAVPPWWRDRVPLIYIGGELAAVADLWICEGFVATDDGWRLTWYRERAEESKS